MDSIKTGGGEAAMFRVLPVMRPRCSLGGYTPLSSVILIRNSGQSWFGLIKLPELRNVSELNSTWLIYNLSFVVGMRVGWKRCVGVKLMGSEERKRPVIIKQCSKHVSSVTRSLFVLKKRCLMSFVRHTMKSQLW